MRFLKFDDIDRVADGPTPGLDSIPPTGVGALPEQDRWSGPHNDLSSEEGPGHYINDVDDLSKGTGTVSGSDFTTRVNVIPPRSVPR